MRYKSLLVFALLSFSFAIACSGSPGSASNASAAQSPSSGSTPTGTGTTAASPTGSNTPTGSIPNSGSSSSGTATPPTGGCAAMSLGQLASLNGFLPFPANDAWNQDISGAAVDPNSAAIISYIGNAALHADFGSGTYNGAPMGIPYVVVDSSQPNVNVSVTSYPGESDLSPMPLPGTAPIEGYL